jgi:hypothetical protein
MLTHKFLLWRISDFFKRLLSRGSEPGGVPPVGVREPRRRTPGGRGAAAAVREPDEPIVITARR